MQTNDLTIELRGDEEQIALITLNRPTKRNALNDGLVLAIRDIFQGMPHSVRAAVIHGNGDHFCAGLDLSELSERNAAAGVHHSRMWHHALDQVERGPVPVVAALHGAVVGGGLELASACHIRVADASAFFALPEGSRGIFVGGGGSVRIPRLIGAARMADMMFTGRVLGAEEGERVGLAQYLVPQGTALEKALELATRIASNAPLTNYALMQALPRIADQTADHGFFTEALISAIVQDAPEAKARVREFLEGRGPKVKKQ
ncbi:crotonase/enoyl-CoA hydratase family protein [Hydrogenophaga crocea]|uniref:Crotonase/enoyl-CoA hydratase family protein n=1 Tax=Hydrogenophaga crocea TaxID=2716225 RepID=A0A6G8IN78_9BURK|nr:crotonase/enoyl-CoA hydratase family protein [Hydrogenophaga crocea]QIM54644.1 crotonase/enoyl-CoA hydratase family protein [Hydrogenophaga crocea]